MLDELQAEAPDYEIDPLNYLLSVGQSLEEIEQYRKDGIPLTIVEPSTDIARTPANTTP